MAGEFKSRSSRDGKGAGSIEVVRNDFFFLLRYRSVPFPLTSAEEVNQWVANATNGHIPHFLADIPHDVMLMLMNAMYFKGETFLLGTGVTGSLFTSNPPRDSNFDKCVEDQCQL